MADVTITNSQITAIDEAGDVTANAATETTDETAQDFVYTPTAQANGVIFRVVTSAGVTVKINEGDEVFANNDSSETLTSGTYIYHFDLGKYIDSDGEVVLTFTPTGTSEDLVNDCALSVEAYEIDLDTQ